MRGGEEGGGGGEGREEEREEGEGGDRSCLYDICMSVASAVVFWGFSMGFFYSFVFAVAFFLSLLEYHYH